MIIIPIMCWITAAEAAFVVDGGGRQGSGESLRYQDHHRGINLHRASSSQFRRPKSLLAIAPDEWSRRELLSNAAAALATSIVTQQQLGSPQKANSATNAATTTETDPLLLSSVPFPFSTRRTYKHIQLSNGLKVLLVKDKNAVRACAALSISGAGQFQEDPAIGGLAHLLEHMVSSASSRQDFEDWLEESAEGASNAFTGPDQTVYHFNVPTEFLAESLSRFAELFDPTLVERTCRNEAILKREIRRVDAELDFSNEFIRSFYLLKSLTQKDHPFSRFTQGSVDSLERTPNKLGIDVASKLIDFFRTRYLPSRAALVVISSNELDSLEKWVAPFASVLSRAEPDSEPQAIAQRYPQPLTYATKPAQFILWRPKGDSPLTENIEKLSIHWLLDRHYTHKPSVLKSTTVGFFVAQLIDRRGPGSLYMFLLRRGWIPEGSQGLPRISFPIDISGFQLIRLDIALTIEGFINRSAVVASLYDCLQAVTKITNNSFNIPDDRLKQYVALARLYGYNIAPRPSDAVELAVDAQTYGMGGTSGVGVEGIWPQLPPLDDATLIAELKLAIAEMLRVITDPKFATIILTASNQAIVQSRNSIVNDPIPPPLMSKRWQIEQISGARYLTDDMMSIYGYVEEWIANRFDEDEILPPSYNPLIPSKLRPPRPIREQILPNGATKLYYIDPERDSVWREFVTKSTEGNANQDSWEDRALRPEIGPDWQLYQTTAVALPLPMMPNEPTCRCSMVVQLLSTRPARATVNQAAFAQLWMLSFENAIQDLAELGAPAGLAYDLSFNKFGLRLCFLGISQNIAAYSKRFCRRLVNHHNRLMLETEIKAAVVDRSVLDANRMGGLSSFRKRQLIGVIKEASAQEASREGKTFLASCSGALCLVQGDILPKEAVILVGEIKGLFDAVRSGSDVRPPQAAAVAELSDILYKPFWKPRSASLCSIPGVPLISDSCGRIPR